MFFRNILLILAFTGVNVSFIEAQRETGIPEIDSLPLDDWRVPNPPLSYSKALLYSALFPGGGQIYGRHYVRAGFLMGLEFGLGMMNLSQNAVLKSKNDEARLYLDSANLIFDELKLDPQNETLIDQRNTHITSARKRIDIKMKQLDLRKSELAWTIGLHFYGIADAMEIVYQSHGINRDKLSTSTALWYAFIPGGGQIYNKKFGKFGMLWMALGSSAASIYFRQDMVEYFQNRLKMAKIEGDTKQISTLEDEVTTFRKSRNQYFWGITVLYLYSIGDAVVDASLNDFDAPDKYALVPGSTPLSFHFLASF